MSHLAERIKSLPPDKLDLLRRQLRPPAGTAPASPPREPGKRLFRPAEDENFQLQIAKPGIFESLTFRARPRLAPGPTEVEVEVAAASLNFRDAMVALGGYPTAAGVAPPPFGADCSGRIVRVGEKVERFRVGDEVMCAAGGVRLGGIAAFTTTGAATTMPKPAGLSFEQAATIPLVFATAYYALHTVARLTRGERVLIHSAAGGVGLAAVQVAQWSGAEIFATAGTAEKRDFLRSLGIRHVMDSRSPGFAEEVLQATGQEGVDVILNSLPAGAIAKGLQLLRVHGRFLELGKREFLENLPLGMFPFMRGLLFAAIDAFFTTSEADPLYVELGERFADGTFRPLPMRTFPVSEVAEALRYLTQGTHIGKVVLVLKDQPVLVEPNPGAGASVGSDGGTA